MKKESEMIYGMHAIIEAIDAGKEIDKIIMKNDMQGRLSHDLFKAIEGRNIPIMRVPIERLDRITKKNHQGVIAFTIPVAYQHIEDIIPTLYEEGKAPFIVVLDGITDVRNFGAIARTCECAGVHAIVIPEKNSASINADAIQTSAGALLKIPVCREKNLTNAIKFLKNSGLKIVATSDKATDNYTDIAYTDALAIIMGAEDVGIAIENQRLCDTVVKIPIVGTISSLNVSVATGIIAYEVLKQRL
jgi:23S rRNA (guanosine2251-2'-O)-methyltransferase